MIVAPRADRRGYSLVEMLVVITVVAALLGLSAVMMQVLFRVGSDAHARRTATSALGRLAGQFREDVHACDGENVELKPGAVLRLSRGRGLVIAYEPRAGRVERVESVNGQAVRRESYDLGRRASAAFERRDDGPRRFLALVVGRAAGARPVRDEPPKPMEILALVGKDRPGPPRSRGGQDR